MKPEIHTKPGGHDGAESPPCWVPASRALSAAFSPDSDPLHDPKAAKRAICWATVGVAGIVLALLPSLAGCDRPVASSPAPSSQPSPTLKPAPGNQREKQAAFLNQIRSADPGARTIDRALINEQNELGLVLDRSVELDKIPALMRVMLTKMAEKFPGEDLTVLAYTPSNPPQKVGTARLNAQTRDMTYTRE